MEPPFELKSWYFEMHSSVNEEQGRKKCGWGYPLCLNRLNGGTLAEAKSVMMQQLKRLPNAKSAEIAICYFVVRKWSEGTEQAGTVNAGSQNQILWRYDSADYPGKTAAEVLDEVPFAPLEYPLEAKGAWWPGY